MSFLAEMDRYLTVRRQLGTAMTTDGRILRRFVTFAAATARSTSALS